MLGGETRNGDALLDDISEFLVLSAALLGKVAPHLVQVHYSASVKLSQITRTYL